MIPEPTHSRSFLGHDEARALLIASKPFACAHRWRSIAQLVTMAALFSLCMWLSSQVGAAYAMLLVPLVTGLFVRLFILQHDCGHRSLFRSRRANDFTGLLISMVTSVPYHAWRTEHNWHHNHQGKLEKRGVDNMNSPMMVDEVPERPGEARYRIAKITPVNIFMIGIHSLLIERKVAAGFFPFREAFQDRVKNRRQMLVGIATILPLHALWHVGIVLCFGWWTSLLVLVPSMAIGSGLGALLFWVQHNFEDTYYANAQEWNRANVAVHGSSYLRFGPVLRWFTGDIGVHHVHHLNQGIPNYRLEEARRVLPHIRDVAPLDRTALERSFTHLFWDPREALMKSPEDLPNDLS